MYQVWSVRRWIALAAALTAWPGCYLSHERGRDAAPVDAPRVCPAMDVRTLPGCTIGVDAYWYWDGRACAASVCACSGSDCAAVMPSRDACDRRFTGCPDAG